MLLYSCITHLLSSCSWQGSKWAESCWFGRYVGWWFERAAGQNGALSQKLLVTLLNSTCHKGLFLLHTGAVFMQSFCLQKYGSDPILASHRHSFVSHWKKASKKKWWPCYMFVDWFPPRLSSDSSWVTKIESQGSLSSCPGCCALFLQPWG